MVTPNQRVRQVDDCERDHDRHQRGDHKQQALGAVAVPQVRDSRRFGHFERRGDKPEHRDDRHDEHEERPEERGRLGGQSGQGGDVTTDSIKHAAVRRGRGRPER